MPVYQANAQVLPQKKDSLKTKHLWLASQLLPGTGQVVNKQYWKIPVFYAGMGSLLYLGVNANKKYERYRTDYDNLGADASALEKEYYQQRFTKKKYARNLYYAGAGAFYIASVADAIMVYNKYKHSAGTATVLSTLVPGLGQAYNKKYWKVPVVYGGLCTLYFLVNWNNRGYVRFKTAISQYPNDEFNKGIKPYVRTVDEFKLYRDVYRKNRDISFVGMIAFYALNIIDANVDANLYDWNVSDDLALRIEPSIINTNFASTVYTEPAFGLSCRINF